VDICVAGMFKAINGSVIKMAESERSLSGGVCVFVCVASLLIKDKSTG
jgi:hypothetical protein